MPTNENVVSTFRAVGTQANQQETDQSGAIKLKWRARHPNAFVLNEAGEQENDVRQVTQITELNDANPFDDPFEDRARGQFSSTQLQPGENRFSQPGANRFSQPGQNFQLPPSTDICEGCGEKCYNGRNCCNEQDRCRIALDVLRTMTIDRISLNISPSIKPDAETEEEQNAAREEQLFQAESRIWRDIEGNELTEGNLIDFRNGRVFIASANGETNKFAFADLSDDDRCFVAAWWKIPAKCRLGDDKYVARSHVPMTMTWTASQACHKPLYFEEIALERYGHTSGPIIQPWISGAHFFTNIAVMPYRMGINPLNECQYDLGYYRPGNCAPWLLPPFPLSPRGAIFQAGAITGVSYLIP